MRTLWRFLKEQRGSSTIMVALALMAMLGMGALAVDLGYVFSTRAEVQKAADAAALAAAFHLVQIYNQQGGNLTLAEVTASATEAAGTWAQQNTSTGNPDVPLTVATRDVVVGVWDVGNKTFTAGGTVDQINAVKVTVRRDQTSNGPIQLFFGSVVGVSTVNVSAQAIAYVGYVGSVPEGGVTLPLLISQEAYVQGTDVLRFRADGTDNSGWSIFFSTGGGASLVGDYIDGTQPVPAVKVGDMLEVYNGVMSNNIFQYMQGQVAEHGGEWHVVLPIVGGEQFVQQMRVVGFATFVITSVETAPGKVVCGHFTTGNIQGGKPGGGNFGSRAGHVVLVKRDPEGDFSSDAPGGANQRSGRKRQAESQRRLKSRQPDDVLPLGRGCQGRRPVFSVESPPQESRPTLTASSIPTTSNTSALALYHQHVFGEEENWEPRSKIIHPTGRPTVNTITVQGN
ncbi:MAG: hypothetical protein KJ621_16640 [Proteobacteria bacterium]|nr:hypothetical protein [Pseudomonadota bacterium]